MGHWLRELDELLRGRRTTLELLRAGTSHLDLRALVGVSLVLAVLYGECMGCPSLVNRAHPQYLQMVSSGLKVPALFFLTLVVTFPSLYVFTALLGVPLRPLDTLRVVVSALAVNIAVLASFGLITLFFTFCTSSYVFMVLLNFAFFATSGLIGLGFLVKVLDRIEAATAPAPPGADESVEAAGVVPAEAAHETAARRVFQIWLLLYALVGAQMGWILRPFIGAPNLPFAWFRVRESNVFVAVWEALSRLLGL